MRTCDVRKVSLNGAAPPGPGAGHPSGLTLVEMLVTVVVGTMILGLVFLIFNSASRSYVRQDAQLEQAQNLRVGLYTIARDLRMAGGGFRLVGGQGQQTQRLQVPVYLDGREAAWFQYPDDTVSGAMAIHGLDGGPGGTDSVTVCWLGLEFATPIGHLASPLTGGGTILALKQSPPLPTDVNAAEDENLAGGDVLMVVDGAGNAVALKIAADVEPDERNIPLERALPAALPNGLASWPEGSAVFNVKTLRLVTYAIGPGGDLTANFYGRDLGDADAAGAVLVAPNIEDLQLWYFEQGTNPASPAGGRNGLSTDLLVTLNTAVPRTPIRSARVALSSRASVRDPYDRKHSPYQWFNHQTVGPEDAFARRRLDEVVQLRNF